MKYRILAFLAFSILALSACGNPFAAAIPDRSAYEIRDGLRYQTLHQTFRDGQWVDLPLADPVPAGDDATPAKPVRKPVEKPDAAAGIYETASYIGRLTALLILASIASLVASYWLPWLPKGAAWKGFAVAGGLIVVRYWLVAYGVVFAVTAFWLTLAVAVAAGIAVGYPWFIGLKNRSIIAAGKALAAKGDARAGAALVIVGSPDDYKKPGEKTALKDALSFVGVKQ